jgi:hypothetical protein
LRIAGGVGVHQLALQLVGGLAGPVEAKPHHRDGGGWFGQGWRGRLFLSIFGTQRLSVFICLLCMTPPTRRHTQHPKRLPAAGGIGVYQLGFNALGAAQPLHDGRNGTLKQSRWQVAGGCPPCIRPAVCTALDGETVGSAFVSHTRGPHL